MYIATYSATSNIAVVKYWGKRNEELLLPQNSSLSFTMDETLKTITSVMFSETLKKDELWLNNKNIDLSVAKNRSHLYPIDLIRQKAGIDLPVRIVSKNLFPTGAGFASSASGVAALVCAGAGAAQLNLSPKDLSILARLGSGSATRSIFGGFVEWLKGEREDGSDSYAEQIVSHDHWPELRNVVAIVETEEKKVSSRQAMKLTSATSSLFQKRIEILPETIKAVKKAVIEKDFPSFAELIMRESNNMHASMLDTWPPIMYLSDASRSIMFAIEELNDKYGTPIAGYTFDAGPNAHIYTTSENVEAVQSCLDSLPNIQKTLVCGIGSGPKEIKDPLESLIDVETGSPRT